MTSPVTFAVQDLDSRIVEELRRDGRIGRNELAAKLNVSRPTVSKRLNALLESGRVHVVGIVHPSTIGLDALGHVAIAVDQPVRQVAARIATLHDVPYVSLVSGRYPLIAEVRTVGAARLASSLERIRCIDGVRETNTLVYSDLIVDIGRPDKVAATRLDPLDVRLLGVLQDDGRASYSVLAEEAGTSPGTARIRVKRLIDDGVLRIGALTGAGQSESEVAVGFGVRATGRAADLGALISEMPGVRFLAATIGRYDLLGTVHATRLEDVVPSLDAVRALRSVLEVDSWVHLNTVKERYNNMPALSTIRGEQS
ncbi:Lrp/AsnC family transcriptional regulator [Rhodococcus sp. 7Tela_A2]|uniref:Lrp/AsnC family transcriptional regulator n=1 Tax=unclassified Rhodococcus (in: high G+C Gram-positive bacteria) TaxID=192944 RepID=UPI0036671790